MKSDGYESAVGIYVYALGMVYFCDLISRLLKRLKGTDGKIAPEDIGEAECDQESKSWNTTNMQGRREMSKK